MLLGLLGVGVGTYGAYSTATRVPEPVYSRAATKQCLERNGFSVTAQRAPEAPGRHDLYVEPTGAGAAEYPTLHFFTTTSDARDYARGDSVPLLRRGNVVVGVENYDGASESMPVKALLGCLRSARRA